jgi:formylglycine-generating enzyme required for sulfatase activity
MSGISIFVSHSHHDTEFCLHLVNFLSQHIQDADIFFDSQELHAGDEWIKRIQKEVINRPIFIVILSQYSVIAEWVREETNLALARAIKDSINRRVVPLKIEDCDIDLLAPLLTTRQVIDLGINAPDANWEDLLRVVRGEVSNIIDHAYSKKERAIQYAANTHEAFWAQRWRDTIDFGEQAVQMEGNELDASLWGELGIAYSQVGKYDEALARLERSLELNDNRPDYWQEKAIVLMEMPSPDYQAALEAWGYARRSTSDPYIKLKILDQQYRSLVTAGMWPQALETSLLALDFHRDDLFWLKNQLESLINLRRNSEALELVRRLTQREDASAELWIARAQLAFDINQSSEEIAVALDKAEQMDRENRSVAHLRWKFLHEISPLRFPAYLREQGYVGRLINDTEVILPPVCGVSSGSFLMGSDKSVDLEADGDETPQHTVTLESYSIGKFQVTVAEYWCAIRAGAANEPYNWSSQLGKFTHPVVNVTWYDAINYCKWLSQITGDVWRLPTEAEWEKAARGTDGRIYPWGNQWDTTRCNTAESNIGSTVPVGYYGEKGASPFGVQDTASNVWDWCSSLYKEFPYRPDDGRENLSTPSGKRVLHGASWEGMKRFARVACRSIANPGSFDHDRGFRLVKDIR